MEHPTDRTKFTLSQRRLIATVGLLMLVSGMRTRLVEPPLINRVR